MIPIQILIIEGIIDIWGGGGGGESFISHFSLSKIVATNDCG